MEKTECYNCNLTFNVSERRLEYTCRPKLKYKMPEYKSNFTLPLCDMCYQINSNISLIGYDKWDAMDGLIEIKCYSKL